MSSARKRREECDKLNRRFFEIMAESKIIREWLSDYKTLRKEEINTFASTVRQNEQLINAIYDLFEEDFVQEVAGPVCNQLCNFYRSQVAELQRFTLEFVPLLLGTYLLNVALGKKRKVGGIEVCLLEIYNLGVVGEDGKGKIERTTIPTLARPSIYHEPPSLATLALTESVLTRYHSDYPVVISSSALSQVETVSASNRMSVMTNVLRMYNLDIANLSPRSHECLCRMASDITQQGFEGLASSPVDDQSPLSTVDDARQEPRVTLTSGFLVELLNGIYFTMFNGYAAYGIRALEDIHCRASYELYADVLMVTGAIKNSLRANPSGQPQDGPIGISVALSPSSSNLAFSKKRAITNASFRARKLPEDIEVPEEYAENMPPPDYHDVLEQDKAKQGYLRLLDTERFKTGAAKLAKPIKNIMKSAKGVLLERRDSDKRKDVAPHQDGHSPRSSLHSDTADPSYVQVNIIGPQGLRAGEQFDPSSSTGSARYREHASRPTTLEGVASSPEGLGSADPPLLGANSCNNSSLEADL